MTLIVHIFVIYILFLVVRVIIPCPLFSDEWDYEADSAVRKAGRYATHYYDDHDSMSNASKRQDRALLNDITSRLVCAINGILFYDSSNRNNN